MCVCVFVFVSICNTAMNSHHMAMAVWPYGYMQLQASWKKYNTYPENYFNTLNITGWYKNIWYKNIWDFDEIKNSIFICTTVVFFVQCSWNILHTLTVDESVTIACCVLYFMQRCVNKLQPWGITVGQVSFISVLEWKMCLFPTYSTKWKDHQCCWTWLPFNMLKPSTKYDMHTNMFMFVSPVKSIGF